MTEVTRNVNRDVGADRLEELKVEEERVSDGHKINKRYKRGLRKENTRNAKVGEQEIKGRIKKK